MPAALWGESASPRPSDAGDPPADLMGPVGGIRIAHPAFSNRTGRTGRIVGHRPDPRTGPVGPGGNRFAVGAREGPIAGKASGDKKSAEK